MLTKLLISKSIEKLYNGLINKLKEKKAIYMGPGGIAKLHVIVTESGRPVSGPTENTNENSNSVLQLNLLRGEGIWL